MSSYTEDMLVPELPSEVKTPTITDLKNFNKLYVTRVLPSTAYCNHKIDPELEPRTNCQTCWLSYFNNNAENVHELIDKVQTPEGEAEIIKKYNSKYVRNFKRFLAAVKTLEESGQE